MVLSPALSIWAKLRLPLNLIKSAFGEEYPSGGLHHHQGHWDPEMSGDSTKKTLPIFLLGCSGKPFKRFSFTLGGAETCSMSCSSHFATMRVC